MPGRRAAFLRWHDRRGWNRHRAAATLPDDASAAHAGTALGAPAHPPASAVRRQPAAAVRPDQRRRDPSHPRARTTRRCPVRMRRQPRSSPAAPCAGPRPSACHATPAGPASTSVARPATGCGPHHRSCAHTGSAGAGPRPPGLPAKRRGHCRAGSWPGRGPTAYSHGWSRRGRRRWPPGPGCRPATSP
ncbi:hypothetical protein D3C72_1622720 [compost metagenome]